MRRIPPILAVVATIVSLGAAALITPVTAAAPTIEQSQTRVFERSTKVLPWQRAPEPTHRVSGVGTSDLPTPYSVNKFVARQKALQDWRKSTRSEFSGKFAFWFTAHAKSVSCVEVSMGNAFCEVSAIPATALQRLGLAR